MEDERSLLTVPSPGDDGSPSGVAIEMTDASVGFRRAQEKVTALDHVDFTAQRGQFVAIMGASGSGKSTLLNCIGGLQELDDGAVVVEGTTLSGLSEDQRANLRLTRIGLVFQDDNLIPVFTALENVTLPLFARGWAAADAEAEGKRWLERVGLADLADSRPAEMSGGQRQRVGIARAVAGSRGILLADEPTGALDSVTTREVLGVMRDLARDGVCVVVVSHDPVVRSFADRVHTMVDGTLHEQEVRA